MTLPLCYSDDGPAAPKEDDEAPTMTLEEYQAKQAAERKGTAFQTRKAGENEDDSQWKNFAPLKKDEEGTYMGGLVRDRDRETEFQGPFLGD